MSAKYDNFSSLKFGRMKPIKEVFKEGKKSKWLCMCDCGSEKVVDKYSLTGGNTKSCGCLLKDFNQSSKRTHGIGYENRVYRIWNGMRTRCNNPNSKDYRKYGERGIKVCDEWNDFKTFQIWAVQNGYSDNLSIDRIDNDNGYSPDNCRWADAFVQNSNRKVCK